jgi:hypothetical protein
MKWKHLRAMFTEERKDRIEIELINRINKVNRCSSNAVTATWTIIKAVNEQIELDKSKFVRLKTTADNHLLCSLPNRTILDGDVDIMIHEADIVEFCNTGRFEPDQTNHTSITVKNSHCKRCRFFVKERNFICMIFLHDSENESVDSSLVLDYYGFQILLEPYFMSLKRIELVMQQMFGEKQYREIYDSIIDELQLLFR